METAVVGLVFNISHFWLHVKGFLPLQPLLDVMIWYRAVTLWCLSTGKTIYFTKHCSYLLHSLLSSLLWRLNRSCLAWIHVSFTLKVRGCVWYAWQFTFLRLQHLKCWSSGISVHNWLHTSTFAYVIFEPYQIQETLALEVTWEWEMKWGSHVFGSKDQHLHTILWNSEVTLLLPGFPSFSHFPHQHISPSGSNQANVKQNTFNMPHSHLQ